METEYRIAHNAKVSTSARLASLLVAAVWILVAVVWPIQEAIAGPPPGTSILNTAGGSGIAAGVPFTVPNSNTVQTVVAAGATGATLVFSQSKSAQPATSVAFAHVLTNGTGAETYTLSAVDVAGGFNFVSISIFPDANGDGVADSLVPIVSTGLLAAGQVFRFVVVAAVPAGAAAGAMDQISVQAAAPSLATPLVNTDSVTTLAPPPPPDPCRLLVAKSISQSTGPSPAGPLTIRIAYNNPICADANKSNITISDRLPAGMAYVPGSARWGFVGSTNEVTLTDQSGDSEPNVQGGLSYDFGASQPGTVSALFSGLAGGQGGYIQFQISIAAGLPEDTRIDNIAAASYTDSKSSVTLSSNSVSYLVTGRLGVRLQGETIQLAVPAGDTTFRNRVTNIGSTADSYNISLSGSTFPAGTIFNLFRADGLTPLGDGNGDGAPDTGTLLPGQTIDVVVKAILPGTAGGGPFEVLKTARSVTSAAVFSADHDRVLGVTRVCRVIMDPDHNGRVGIGRSVVYPHLITNTGNCDDTVTFPGQFKTDSLSTWTSEAYLDEPATTSMSKVAGLIDSGDVKIDNSTVLILKPGQSQRVLVRVTASESAIVGDANTTTVQASSSGSGVLRIVDITRVETRSDGEVSDVIRNFTSESRVIPTIWAVIGSNLYLRADAPSCNGLDSVIESRTVILLGPNGEREELTAVETGPNTGVFVVNSVPVRRPPVRAADRIVEGNAGDVMSVEVLGCNRRINTTVTLLDPGGVVFDSRSNEPIPGAVVRLVTATGNTCSASLASVRALNASTGELITAPNPVTTGADGRFEFQVVAEGSYCALVTTPNGYTFASAVPFDQLPPGRNILATGPTSGGSYGGAFLVNVATGPVAMDIPVDAGAVSGLFVQKKALREVVDMGETLDYEVRVKNQTGLALSRSDTTLIDRLPAGFSYVSGSARINGNASSDPQKREGSEITFNLGRMARGQEVTLTYRIRVGPGAMQGDGINRVVANYQIPSSGLLAQSNTAMAKVKVQGGVFSDKAYLLGKIYADCNANGYQDEGETGVPGVRFFLEDGTSVISDSEGKYSLYGLTARTRVLKVDRSTLPAGARLAAFGNRSGGKGDSRFVDLKNGELHRADFTIEGCEAGVTRDIAERRKQARDANAEIEGRLQQKLETDAKANLVNDPKSLPATGILGAAQGAGTISPVNPNQTAPTATVAAEAVAGSRLPTVRDPLPKTIRKVELPLETVIAEADNVLGFVGLKDGDRLPYAQTSVRVKGTEGARFKLEVNGVEIGADRIGQRTTVAERKLQAWEFVGVDLKAGENLLKLSQFDSFGNARGTASITLIAPDKLGKLIVELPSGAAVADGKTPARVTVKLTDDKGVPVTVRTAINLDSSNGVWRVEDLDPREAGIQTFIEGGSATFSLLPPTQPGPANIRVSSGIIETEVRLDFLPDLRDLIAAGVIEGVLNLRKLSSTAMVPARSQDGFEQELNHFARSSDEGKRDAKARAAFFLKGKVKGEYLLTLAYDSDKDGRERLFRDIQPDEFYPVYGDASTRGFDAQSTQRLYVRVDKRKSWVLYGDFSTSGESNSRRLANYNRSLTGAKAHFEEGRIVANLFASRDSTRQVIEEVRANGTSGPYLLSSGKGLVNSERVELLTRDRNQPSLILQTLPQSRFTDYEMEPLTGRILFRGPVPSLDADLNPISIRITYEIDQGGEDFWVAGGDVQVKVSDNIEVGATYVKDKNPAAPFEMRGANASVKIGERTMVIGEVAQTEQALAGAAPGKGNAQRIEIRHRSEMVEAEAYYGRSDVGFDNPGAFLSRGRAEAGAKANIRVDERTRARLEALHSEDRATGGKRDGVMASVEHTLGNGLRLEAGLRHAKESAQAALPVYPNDLNQGSVGTGPNEVTSIRGRVTGPVPGFKEASLYGELEVDLKDTDRKIAAVGGEYLLPNRGRVYARHEFISSLTGPYGLNSTQRQNSTVFGVDTEYMKDGKLFSEYRIRDALSGGDAEAAFGLRNLWTLGEGIRLGTGFERIHALSGKGEAESSAITLGLEYTANPLWKGTARLELRDGATSDSVLSTVGFASKLNRDWTFLGRNTYNLTRNRGANTGELMQDRLQAGVAYRETDSNVWSGMARIEHRAEKDTTQAGIELKRSVEILSLHANFQPRRPFTLSGRYAAKLATDKSNGLVTKSNAQLISGRAIWEFAPRFDLSINVATLLGQGASKRQYGLGFEVGYLLTDNLWLSGGFNVLGFSDDDLVAGDYTNKGAFVRLRYKFDEDLLQARPASEVPSRGVATEVKK